jgi:hypothetical protein
LRCSNPSCGCYDYSGAAEISCPNCGHTIGVVAVDTTPPQPVKPKQKSSITNKQLLFYKVVDKTTRNYVSFYVKAASHRDALGVARRLYRIRGFVYNQWAMNVSKVTNPSEVKGYYVWQGTGPSKTIIERTLLPTGEFV